MTSTMTVEAPKFLGTPSLTYLKMQLERGTTRDEVQKAYASFPESLQYGLKHNMEDLSHGRINLLLAERIITAKGKDLCYLQHDENLTHIEKTIETIHSLFYLALNELIQFFHKPFHEMAGLLVLQEGIKDNEDNEYLAQCFTNLPSAQRSLLAGCVINRFEGNPKKCFIAQTTSFEEYEECILEVLSSLPPKGDTLAQPDGPFALALDEILSYSTRTTSLGDV